MSCRKFLIAVLAMVSAAPGCGPAASNRSQPPSAAQALGHASCKSEGNTAMQPLLVEWPASDRAMLEAAAKSGLVAVRYDGCQLEVLSRCSLEGVYTYRELNHKHDDVRIRDNNSLWTELPLGAARLEGSLSRTGQINVDMVVVGRLDADVDELRPTGPPSACEGATHLVSGMTVGAFSMYTGTAFDASASVSAGGKAGAGTKVERSNEVLRQDGHFEACEMQTSGTEPPAQCGALLRVELAPLAHDGKVTSVQEQARFAQARRLERAADHWRKARRGSAIAAGISAAGTLASLAVVVVRSVQIGAQSPDAGEDSNAKIPDYRRDRRMAGYASLGFAVGVVSLATLSVVAKRHSRKLQSEAAVYRKTTLLPVVGPNVAGVVLRGRF